MRHDWVFDVLADLRAYAEENNLPALAAQITATLRVADKKVAEEAFARLSSLGMAERDERANGTH
jgi:hypothetical protein